MTLTMALIKNIVAGKRHIRKYRKNGYREMLLSLPDDR